MNKTAMNIMALLALKPNVARWPLRTALSELPLEAKTVIVYPSSNLKPCTEGMFHRQVEEKKGSPSANEQVMKADWRKNAWAEYEKSSTCEWEPRRLETTETALSKEDWGQEERQSTRKRRVHVKQECDQRAWVMRSRAGLSSTFSEPEPRGLGIRVEPEQKKETRQSCRGRLCSSKPLRRHLPALLFHHTRHH